MNIIYAKYKLLADNLLIVFCTGLPGLHRVLMFIVVERLYTIMELGDFSSDMSIVYLLSYFTAVGWSSLVMTKIPKLEDKEQYLFRLMITSLIYYVFFALILYAMYISGLIKDIVASLLFLFSWMIYQILRHYNITFRAYRRILAVDTSCIIITVLILFTKLPPLIAVAVAYLLVSALFIPNLLELKFKIIPVTDQIKAGEVGLSNFLLGAASSGLPFICGLVVDVKYSALIGFALSFLYVLHLLPRAISSYFVPKMSKLVKDDKYIFMRESVKQFTFSTISLIFASVLLSIIIYVVHLYGTPSLVNIDNALYIMYLLLANSILTVFSLPATDFFLAIEKTKSTLNSSYLYSIVTILSALIFLKFGHTSKDIIYLLIMIFIAGTIRNIYLYIKVMKNRRYFNTNIGKAINEVK